MSSDGEDKVEGSKSSSSLSGRCRRNDSHDLGDISLETCAHRFRTKNFIGRFQFGDVYRGTLYDKEVIVKIWKHEDFPGENKGRLEDERRFHEYFERYEFHPNVAKARAICHGRKHLACVYELNPYAIDTLHNLIDKDTFKWEHRVKVAFGLASLLRYMHTPHPNCPSKLPYLIRNLDAAHIMVDQDHEPVLFDFSMISGGILTDKRDLLNQNLQGWCCYSHPNCPERGRCSDKCDVYSYGVVLLSLLSKRTYKHDDDYPAVSLANELAKNELRQCNSVACFGKKFKSSLLHESLERESDLHSSDAFKITKLALRCMIYDPQKRPSMSEVVRDLHGMHIVQHNANTWECCKMLDGVNEVHKTPNPPKHRRVKEFWRPLHWGLLVNWSKCMMRGNKGCGQTLAREFNIFSYKELINATSRFGKENLIGQFQYGNVFWGEIKGKKVIVKMWEIDMKRGIARHGNEERLRDEISLLQHPELFCHPNLVKMIGYCFEKGKLGAVYDLDPQDTLHNLATKDEFTWLQRMKVIYEFANLIEFFHAPNPPHVPYRVGNIEAANIFLDKDYRPILFDFGMTVGGIILSLRETRNWVVRRRLRGYEDRTTGIGIEVGDIGAYGWILLCLISKTSPRPDVDDPIFDALELKHSEKLSDVKQPAISIVHGDLKQERGFNENDGIELTKLGICWDKCDVYAYGVILLSLPSKRIYKHSDDGTGVSLPYELDKNELKPRKSVGCFGRKFNPFLLHESLECESEFCSSDAFKIMQLALECMECDPQKRPSMIKIVRDMQKLHIVQHNANTWECCKMLNGVNEGVIKGKKVIVKMWEIDMERGIARRDNEDRLRDEISLLQHPELFCHPNLVKMIGYCFDEKKLGAVYDLDPQDSLHNLAPKDEFTWLQRMKVIYEFAELLKFFHAPNPPHAPYRVGNIEAVNIILDKDYRPKLFDFGMTTGGIILSLREARNRYVPRRLRGYGDRTRGIYIEEGDIGAYGWILLCLISKTSPSTDVDGQIFDALRRQRYSEESSDVKQPVTSICAWRPKTRTWFQ
ncbi:Receptor-like protein kinase [Euphorbia peplus]|nr:Receptor-like protein kinase [Euphorbia peplus]